ncbi:hypothetical protein M422DRAFT_266869 [Sphaerobolus stellatus SS14]|uniref:Uncharacterized protein n=1 Tax=Sphaerobolus stellatus (strain SS14) TaxID=990650 RepID=A0A0C9UQW6_SPHS4|nr:hypothetical protein M422DRAFT_266869 [Sphaerobolus stellatus SS14]
MGRRKASAIKWMQNLGDRANKRLKPNQVEEEVQYFIEQEREDFEPMELGEVSNMTPSPPPEANELLEAENSLLSDCSSNAGKNNEFDLDEEELQDEGAFQRFTEKLKAGMAKFFEDAKVQHRPRRYKLSAVIPKSTKCCHAANIRKETGILREQGYGDIQSFFASKGSKSIGGEKCVNPALDLPRPQVMHFEEEEEEEMEEEIIFTGITTRPAVFEEEEETEEEEDLGAVTDAEFNSPDNLTSSVNQIELKSATKVSGEDTPFFIPVMGSYPTTSHIPLDADVVSTQQISIEFETNDESQIIEDENLMDPRHV